MQIIFTAIENMRSLVVIKIILCLIVSFNIYAKRYLDYCSGEDDIQKGCCVDFNPLPPFYVSDGLWQGEKQYENFRHIGNDNVVKQYVPRGTIVYIPPELYELETSKSYRLPFSVLSVPKPLLEETAKNSLKSRSMFREMFWGVKGKGRVEPGDIGFLDKRGIRQVSEYTFYVNEDAPVYSTPGRTILNGKAIRPKMLNQQFLVKRCCEILPKQESSGPLCYEHYMFDIVNKENRVVDTFSYGNFQCGIFQNMTAVPQTNAQDFSSILALLSQSSTSTQFGIEDIEMILKPTEWKGSRMLNKAEVDLVKFPMDKNNKGPYHTHHYTPDDKGDTDAFLKPTSMCSFLQVAKEFEKKCQGPGCEVQFGNMYHKKSWKKHKSHESGECIDVRPFRKSEDDITRGHPWHSYKKNKNGEIIRDRSRLNTEYDRDKTRDFINLAIKAGATFVFFNDPIINEEHQHPDNRSKLIPTNDGSVWDDWWRIRGNLNKDNQIHDDHVHICFQEENPRVQNSCHDGL